MVFGIRAYLAALCLVTALVKNCAGRRCKLRDALNLQDEISFLQISHAADASHVHKPKGDTSVHRGGGVRKVHNQTQPGHMSTYALLTKIYNVTELEHLNDYQLFRVYSERAWHYQSLSQTTSTDWDGFQPYEPVQSENPFHLWQHKVNKTSGLRAILINATLAIQNGLNITKVQQDITGGRHTNQTARTASHRHDWFMPDIHGVLNITKVQQGILRDMNLHRTAPTDHHVFPQDID